MPIPSLFRRARVVATTLSLAAACSNGGGDGAAEPTAPSAPVTTAPAPPPAAPLTGLPGDPGKLARPLLAVKIDNGPQGRPQAGLESAEVVYEEVVEGGITRFLALFHVTDAANVGPIRSVRPTDPEIVRPLGGLFAYSGGTPKFVGLLRQAPVADVGFDAQRSVYRERRDRRAPNHIYSSTVALFGTAPAGAKPPPPLFQFRPAGQPFAGAGAAPATHLTIAPGGRTTAAYDWDPGSGTWKRSTDGRPHTVEGGPQLAASNVVIQFTPYQATGDVDVTKAPVSVAQLVGTGEAWALSGGALVKGRWSRPSPDSVTSYTDGAGALLALAPGTTWVELAQVGAPTTVR